MEPLHRIIRKPRALPKHKKPHGLRGRFEMVLNDGELALRLENFVSFFFLFLLMQPRYTNTSSLLIFADTINLDFDAFLGRLKSRAPQKTSYQKPRVKGRESSKGRKRGKEGSPPHPKRKKDSFYG